MLLMIQFHGSSCLEHFNLSRYVHFYLLFPFVCWHIRPQIFEAYVIGVVCMHIVSLRFQNPCCAYVCSTGFASHTFSLVFCHILEAERPRVCNSIQHVIYIYPTFFIPMSPKSTVFSCHWNISRSTIILRQHISYT